MMDDLEMVWKGATELITVLAWHFHRGTEKNYDIMIQTKHLPKHITYFMGLATVIIKGYNELLAPSFTTLVMHVQLGLYNVELIFFSHVQQEQLKNCVSINYRCLF
jgi:hypothetical protein